MRRLLLLLTLLSLSAQARNPYRYSINAEKAEDVLASIQFRPRLLDSQWRDLLGDLKLSSYTVKSGDNLWAISKKVLKDPWLYRKLWSVNPELDNPHELEPGYVLEYYRAQRELASFPEAKVPIVKLIPGAGDGISDIDKDSFLQVNLTNQLRPQIFALPKEETIYGEITGSYYDRRAFLEQDILYVKMEGAVKKGMKFGIIHVDRELIDRRNDQTRNLGTLVYYVGEIEILGVGEKLTEARVMGVYGEIRRGDKIVAVRKPIKWDVLINPPDQLQLEILGGEQETAKNFWQGQVVLLDKGKRQGVRVGHVFRVFRNTDLSTKETKGVLPDYKGEIQIIDSSAFSSVGYILRNSAPIEIGDTLMAAQLFPDRENPVKRFLQPVEIY